MADELVVLTDSVNTVDFLSKEDAQTGFLKTNIEGLDPPPLKVTASSGRPIYSSYDNRELTLTFGIVATDAADLTTKQTKLITILENTRLHWESKGGRGLKAQLQYRRPGATAISYIDVFWGECDWGRVDQQQGAAYAYSLKNAQITLTCEPCFHPASVVNLVSAQTIYNHDDSDSGHDNYVDIAAANIKGDIEAPIKLQLYFKVGADAPSLFSCVGGRRTRATPGSFTHIYEGEGFGTKSNWASAAEAKCSAGNKVSDSANASGYIEKTLTLDANHRGEFYCYARLKTDDIANTKFRLRTRDSSVVGWSDRDWTWLKTASQWRFVNLGVLYWDPLLAAGSPMPFWRIEYQKDAADLAELDYVMLLPRDESAFYCDVKTEAQIWGVNHTFIIDETADFAALQLTASTVITAVYYRPRLMLKPGVLNRLYFSAESYDASIMHEVHGATTDLQMDITIDYLPQYLCPLE